MATSRTTSTRRGLRHAYSALAAAVLFGLAATTSCGVHEPAGSEHVSIAGSAVSAPDNGDRRTGQISVRVWEIEYRSHTGAPRAASILLPSWYGPGNNPVLPVVISPHGRGATGHSNATFFGTLPAVGGFAVISPDGMGQRLKNFSYGAPGQIDDLARMPEFARRALPWLRLDPARVFALGSSMGGQETLLLVARHPRLLAGAAALDSVTDLARRYRQLPQLPCSSRCLKMWGKPYGPILQSTLSREIGASPKQNPGGYAARSGLSQARKLAFSRVPLQIWWSREDRIVWDQEHQSQALFAELRRLNPCAPVTAYVGRWAHSTEMRADALLPIALSGFGLLPGRVTALPASVHHDPAASCAAPTDT
jgi:pimeloyl-ACP methyl ester carboxylesterase